MNNQKFFPTEAELRIIRELYDGTTVKINIIMMRLGRKYPRWYVRRLAAQMGLARTKTPNWLPEEESYLEENYHRRLYKEIRRVLKKINGGILRTQTAVVLKARRLKVSKGAEGYTLRGVEALLGVDHHKIHQWINASWLLAKRRGTERKKIQGGDMWYFRPEDLRTFVINHPDEIDLRRVEKFAFIEFLAGEKQTMITCVCPCCGDEHQMYLNWKGACIPRKLCDACRYTDSDYVKSVAVIQ